MCIGCRPVEFPSEGLTQGVGGWGLKVCHVNQNEVEGRMSGRFSLGWSRKPQGHVMRFNFPINTEDNLQRSKLKSLLLTYD